MNPVTVLNWDGSLMLTHLTRTAVLVLPLGIALAQGEDPWRQLGTVDRTNVYTVALRGGTCEEGSIVKLDSNSLVFRNASPDRQLTIARSDILRVGEGTKVHEVLFSGRSSWADVRASLPAPREHLILALKSGQQLKAVSIRTSDSDLTFKTGGKQVTIAKSDIGRVLYVRFKPLSAGYQWFAQEAPYLVYFTPKGWQYALKINAMISVPLYDADLTEDDSPVTCPPRQAAKP